MERRVDATDADFWTRFFGSDSWSGEPVSPQQAMQISTWFSCARKIAQTVATLPIGIYRRLPNGDKEAMSDHPLYGLLHDSPNADQTAVEFWEGRLLGVATGGNGFAEKAYLGNRLVALNRMPPDTHVERRRSDNALVYRFDDRGKEEELPQEKVFHIRGFGDGDCGMSPVEYARQSLGLAIATERAAGNVFSKGLRMAGFFTVPNNGTLDADQRLKIKDALERKYRGREAPMYGVLEAGLDFKSINMTSRDAELILNRKWNVEDICRWFDIPPILIGHAQEGQTMWGSGVEQILLGWLMTGLRPYLVRTEQAIKKRIISAEDRAKGIFAEFAVEGMLRADSVGRAELNTKMMHGAALKPNEWRKRENLPPEDGGDELYINSTLVPLSSLRADAGSVAQFTAAVSRLEALLGGDIGKGRPFPEDKE
jgi:HK97 family phage portal protein